MITQEALQILDRISAMVQMNRTDHARAIEAVKVLTNFIGQNQDKLPKDFLKEVSKDKKSE